MTKDKKKVAIIAALIVGGICLNHLIPRSSLATLLNTSPKDLQQTNSDSGATVSTSDAVTAFPKVYNLGVVEISDGIVSRHDLGDGRVCIVTPTIQKDGSLLLALRIEQDGKLLSSPSVRTKPNQGFEFTVGDVGVGFTPHLKHDA